MDLRKKEFHLPENVYFDPENLTDSYGKLYAEPLERGFGTTIGNALRRVLLSSISGCAVTSIRLPGVLHDYSTLPGVKEDVVDIIFNVKQLRLKMHSVNSKTVSIKVKGPGEVKGRDIITGSHVEVLNPEQRIATLEKKTGFNMELNVKTGRAYVPAEMNKEDDQSVDVIAIDSIYTPIKKVNFWVEGARLGRSTDYDKLIMEIWTDGSVTPPQAVTQASNILSEHLSLFCLEKESLKEAAAAVDLASNKDNDQSLYNKNLLKSVEELELSVRSYNCLKNANISTIADLVQKTEQEMLRTKNFGRKSLNEIKEIISSMGLQLNMRVDTDALQNLIKDQSGEDEA
jgi:DNA-directed RNA polymerase subunit alpha